MHIFLAYMIAVVAVIAVAMVVLNLQKPSADVEIKDIKQGDTIWWYHKDKLYHDTVQMVDLNNDCYVYAYCDEYDEICLGIIPMRDIVKSKRHTK